MKTRTIFLTLRPSFVDYLTNDRGKTIHITSDVETTQRALKSGLQHFRRKHWSKALTHFELALRSSADFGNDIDVGKSLNGLSAVYIETGDYKRSLAYSQAATSVLEFTAAQADYALALHQLGISSLQLEDLSSAQCCFDRALSLYTALDDVPGQNSVLLTLGQLCGQQKQYMYALACYESVLASVVSYPSQSDRQALLLMTLSLTMQLCNEVYGARAIAPYQKVVKHYVPVNRFWQVTYLLRQLGWFHESRQEYCLALRFYAQALKVLPPGENLEEQTAWDEAKKFL